MGEDHKKGLFERAKDKIGQLGETKDRLALLLKAVLGQGSDTKG